MVRRATRVFTFRSLSERRVAICLFLFVADRKDRVGATCNTVNVLGGTNEALSIRPLLALLQMRGC